MIFPSKLDSKEFNFTMPRCLPFAVVIILFTRITAPAAEPRQVQRQPVFPFPIQKTTLDNGLDVISVPFDSPGIIAYYTVVRTGSRNEVEKGLSGFAHFFEHMMFRGTQKYPQEKYNNVLKSLGRRFERLHDRRLDVLSHDHTNLGSVRPSRSNPTGSGTCSTISRRSRRKPAPCLESTTKVPPRRS